jgi:hypothetical protein
MLLLIFAVVVIYTAVTGARKKGKKSNKAGKEKKISKYHGQKQKYKIFFFFSFWFDLSTGSIHVTVLSVDKKLGVASKTRRQRGELTVVSECFFREVNKKW